MPRALPATADSASNALIIGNRGDEHVAAVLEVLAGRTEPLVVDATALEARRYVLDDLTHLSLEDGQAGQAVELSGARGWVRRLAMPGWRTGVQIGSSEATVRASWLALTIGLASTPQVDWVTPYPRLVAAENKLRQAAHARQLGIDVPRTAVVSRRGDIPPELGDQLVAKPLGPAHFTGEDGGARVVWTEHLQREDPRLDALGGAPFLLQELIPARRHLRVVTCCRHAWTCALDADQLPVDWRRSETAHHAFSPAPDFELEAKALALATELGLGYTSQDWIDNGDRHVFIDLNPAGQWLFLPDPVRTEVTETVASHLSGD
jgi:hypothetical protein